MTLDEVVIPRDAISAMDTFDLESSLPQTASSSPDGS